MAKAQKPKMGKIVFSPMGPLQEYTLLPTKQKFDVQGRMTRVPLVDSLPSKVIMKPGDEIEVPVEDLELLIEKGFVRSKEDLKEKQKMIKDKTPVYTLADRERALLLLDLPYEG